MQVSQKELDLICSVTDEVSMLHVVIILLLLGLGAYSFFKFVAEFAKATSQEIKLWRQKKNH